MSGRGTAVHPLRSKQIVSIRRRALIHSLHLLLLARAKIHRPTSIILLVLLLLRKDEAELAGHVRARVWKALEDRCVARSEGRSITGAVYVVHKGWVL